MRSPDSLDETDSGKLRLVTDGGEEPRQTTQDLVSEANDAFAETTLSGMMLYGDLGFHTFHASDNTDPTTVTTTALHAAIEDQFEMVHIDRDSVEHDYGAVTPDTIAEALTNQIEELSAIQFEPFGRDAFVESLADNIRDLNDSNNGGDA
ncbi:hypothetical protein [Halobaculum sp. P14]|uniref:hypothetical protein n=1 Tax=Halobaculum sp. P14 TaxID=3421638 RepID=UPI003EB6EABD